MQRWGRFVARRAALVLMLGVLLIAAAGAYGVGVFGSLSNGGFDDPGSESTRAAALIKQNIGRHGADVIAVYESASKTIDDPEFTEAVADIVDGLPAEALENVLVYGQPGTEGLVSDDRRATTVILALAGDDDGEMMVSYDLVQEALAPPEVLAGADLELSVAGQFAVFDDVTEIVAEDIKRAEILSMPLVLILSLVVFGSIVAALMPVGVGAIAVIGALAVVRLLTSVTDVSVFAINIISLLGMGLAIDYALFVVSRFRDELVARGVSRRERGDKEAVRAAVTATMETAGRTVLFSGLTVAVALSSLLVFPQEFLRSMAYGGVAAVLVAMLAALTVLPAMLALLGGRIEAGAMPWRRKGPRKPSAGWARFAYAVMARPMTSFVLVAGLLIIVASPFLSASWGSIDEKVLPADATSRVATEKVASEFGGTTSQAEIFLATIAEGDVRSYLSALSAVEGVIDVRPVLDSSSGVATASGVTEPGTLIEVTWEGTSQSSASQDVVRNLRAVYPPADAYVGGPTAKTVDMLDTIAQRLPIMIAVIVAAMMVLLFLAFGSIVIPIKAILVNIVSITASFGVVTWIFAEGHFEEQLGFTSPGYLDGTQPILMFAVLFGLSMDYEVFLLSRVREQWDLTGDNDAAVAAGVQKTGGIITSAALLLAVVIGAFATSGIVFVKMIGIGMLVALLLDATLVRLVMVPATMKMLGQGNWWAPEPMQRWWEKHGLREGPSEPEVVEVVAPPRILSG